MTDRDSRYEMAARLIAGAEDPRAELLRVAQLASRHQRNRRRLAIGSSIAGLVLVGLVIWKLPGRSDESSTAPVQVADEAAWVRTQFTDQLGRPLTAEDAERLKRYMVEPSTEIEDLVVAWAKPLRLGGTGRPLTEAQTSRLHPLLFAGPTPPRMWALKALASKGQEVSEERLLWFLRNPEPLMTKVTLSAVLYRASRHKTFADPAAVEVYALGDDRGYQIAAVQALDHMKNHRPSDRLMELLRTGDKDIRAAGREILRRGGQ